MDSIEYTNRRNRTFELAKCGKYKEAAKEADAIDWSMVQNEETIEKVSVIYHKCRHYKDSLRLLEIICQRNPKDIKIIKRICVMAAALGMEEKAWKYYEAYCAHEKSSAAKYILKYRIQRAVKADIKQCILTLHELLKIKYVPKWALELAECYAKAGMTEESIQECQRVLREAKDEECRQKAEKLLEELGWTGEEEHASLEEEQAEETPEESQETESVAEGDLTEDPRKEHMEDAVREEAPVTASAENEELEEELPEGKTGEEELEARFEEAEVEEETPEENISFDIEQKLAGLSQSCEQARKKEQSKVKSQQDIETLLRQIE